MTAKEFIMSLPDRVQQDTIQDKETNFHFDIAGEEGGQYTVEIKDGKVEAKEGLHGEPKCTVKGKDKDLMGVVSGKTNAMMALLTGKIKIDNQGEMLKYAKVFGLM